MVPDNDGLWHPHDLKLAWGKMQRLSETHPALSALVLKLLGLDGGYDEVYPLTS